LSLYEVDRWVSLFYLSETLILTKICDKIKQNPVRERVWLTLAPIRITV